MTRVRKLRLEFMHPLLFKEPISRVVAVPQDFALSGPWLAAQAEEVVRYETRNHFLWLDTHYSSWCEILATVEKAYETVEGELRVTATEDFSEPWRE